MLLHGKAWHRFLWVTHKSHHTPKVGWFEFNDIFAAFHACLAIILIISGCELATGTLQVTMVATGWGMTLFGFSYFTVHDGFIHGRLPVSWLERIPYMRKVRAFHQLHHTVEHGAPYGLFLGPWEYKWAKARGRHIVPKEQHPT